MHCVKRFSALMVTGLLAVLLQGCAQLPGATEPSAAAKASCPALSPPTANLDEHAAALHIAELRGWYEMCRESRLKAPQPQDPESFTGFGNVNGVVVAPGGGSPAAGPAR